MSSWESDLQKFVEIMSSVNNWNPEKNTLVRFLEFSSTSLMLFAAIIKLAPLRVKNQAITLAKREKHKCGSVDVTSVRKQIDKSDSLLDITSWVVVLRHCNDVFCYSLPVGWHRLVRVLLDGAEREVRHAFCRTSIMRISKSLAREISWSTETYYKPST